MADLRHEWVPQIDERGRCMRYACLRCAVTIPAVVVICGPSDEALVREQLPDREIYVFEGLKPGYRQMEDGRWLTNASGRPKCIQREIES